MRLSDDEHAASEARRFARRWAIAESLVPEVSDNLELVLGELVSNAVRYGLAPYEVELCRTDGMIRGEVFDGSASMPKPNPNPDEHGGFGLRIVDACAERWGTQPTTDGKKMWFELKP